VFRALALCILTAASAAQGPAVWQADVVQFLGRYTISP
jgi:hypothetical protein